MSSEADLHNFGRSVQQIGRASGIFYQKPRPVFWEWLFFGKSSPLAVLFDDHNESGIQLRDIIFNLEIEMDKTFSGVSRQVLPAVVETVFPAHAHSLGVLLGYCYIFGIRDLHRHNVVRTESHLQVIDAEVVLVKLLLPHETLLLPFKNIGPDLCAAMHLGNITQGFPLEIIKEILAGYVRLFLSVQHNLDPIRRVFQDQSGKMLKIPIRTIIRDTPHYRKWKTETPEIPFSESELVQLSRGDIPYFFKFIGDEHLYAYSNADGDYGAVEFPKDFEKAVVRDAMSPKILLDSSRISSELLPSGLLFMAKHLMPPTFCGSMDLGGTMLLFSDKTIRANLGDVQFEIRRR